VLSVWPYGIPVEGVRKAKRRREHGETENVRVRRRPRGGYYIDPVECRMDGRPILCMWPAAPLILNERGGERGRRAEHDYKVDGVPIPHTPPLRRAAHSAPHKYPSIVRPVSRTQGPCRSILKSPPTPWCQQPIRIMWIIRQSLWRKRLEYGIRCHQPFSTLPLRLGLG
jgi:hypothetical protein